MKNRIMAILVVIIMCFSMITPVFAATTTTYKGTDLAWEETVYDGEIYQIKYLHPQGYDKLYIVNNSGSANIRNWTMVYYNDSTTFGKNLYQLTGGSVITHQSQGLSYMSPKFEQQENSTKSLLFNENDNDYRTKNFTLKTAISGEAVSLAGDNANPTGPMVLEVGTPEFEDWYVDWYYEEYGAEPPLAGATNPNEYLKGRYYVITKKPVGHKNCPNNTECKNYPNCPYYRTVDTYNEPYHFSEGLDYVYVVTYSPVENGNPTLFAVRERIQGYLSILANALKLIPNDYPVIWPNSGEILMRGTKNERLNNYYFEDLTSAVRFVKSSEWATPVYAEEQVAEYSYNCELIYCNFEVNGFINEIDWTEYGVKQTHVVLKEHGVENPRYLWIEYDYYPYRSQLSTYNGYKILAVSTRHNPKYYYGNTENDKFNFNSKEFYTETDEYYRENYNFVHRFKIYVSGMSDEDAVGSWDLVFSEYSQYEENNSTPTFETLENELTGEKITINHKDGILYGPDGKEYYYDKEKDQYISKDGEIFDLENYKPVNRVDYDASEVIENIGSLFDRLIAILDYAKEKTQDYVRLMTAFMNNVPTIFKTIIILSVIALLIIRIVRR